LHTTFCIDSSSIARPRSVEEVVAMSRKRAREVEAEVESDTHPTIMLDSHDHVLLLNDVYKAMVRQPVCVWLDTLSGADTSWWNNGKVVLNI
jgi:hypothetical protein